MQCRDLNAKRLARLDLTVGDKQMSLRFLIILYEYLNTLYFLAMNE